MAQGRRVRRVIRKFDTWTVAKIAFAMHLCLGVVVVSAGVLLWGAADRQGLVADLEKAVATNLQLDNFKLHGDVLFRGFTVTTLIFACLGTFLTVIGAVLYNLLSDLIGGLQVWVLEEIIEPATVFDIEQVATGQLPVVEREGPLPSDTVEPAAAPESAGASQLEPVASPV